MSAAFCAGICTDFQLEGIKKNSCCFITEFMTRGSLKDLLASGKLADSVSLKDEEAIKRVYALAAEIAQGQVILGFLEADSLICPSDACTAGVQHLHKSGVIHRDLAARNVLVSAEGRVLLCDFGLSRPVDENPEAYYELTSEGLLPLRWLAPESLLNNKFTRATDVWTFGIVIWEILTQ